MSSDNKNVQRVAKCRAKLCRVELLLKPEEREAIKKAASGQPLAAYIKTAVREKMAREAEEDKYVEAWVEFVREQRKGGDKMNELIMQIKSRAEFIEDLCRNCNEDFSIVDKALLHDCLKKLTEVSETLEEYADI